MCCSEEEVLARGFGCVRDDMGGEEERADRAKEADRDWEQRRECSTSREERGKREEQIFLQGCMCAIFSSRQREEK